MRKEITKIHPAVTSYRQWYTGNMDTKPASGYREIPHTADWELEVWAPNLLGLMEQAALGMYQLTGIEISSTPLVSHTLVLQLSEPETMLVDFLNELLFLCESEEIAFSEFDLWLDESHMHAQLRGAEIRSMGKEIKAATYHNLHIVETVQGLIARIVFDV